MTDATATPILLGTSLAWPDGRLSAASSTLIRSKSGATLLVDTGAWHQRKALIAVLEECQVKISEIDAVILTHLHWDHCMNFDMFAGVPLAVSRTEWQRVEDEHFDYATPVYLRQIIDSRSPITLLDPGEFEGVGVIPSPGHTSGHIAVGLETAIGSVAICGDSVPTRSAAIAGMPHAWHSSESDAAESLKSLLQRFDVIIPGHDAPFSTTLDNAILRGMSKYKNEGNSRI